MLIMTVLTVEELRSEYENDAYSVEKRLDELLTIEFYGNLTEEDYELMNVYHQVFTWKKGYKVEVELIPQIDTDYLYGTIHCNGAGDLIEKMNLKDETVNIDDTDIDINDRQMFSTILIQDAEPVVYSRYFKLR